MAREGLRDTLLVALLWFLSAALATWALLSSHQLVSVTLGLVVPPDPLHTVNAAWRAITMERFALVGLVITWVSALIYLMSYYRSRVQKGRQWSAFGRVTVIELLIVGITRLLLLLIL